MPASLNFGPFVVNFKFKLFLQVAGGVGAAFGAVVTHAGSVIGLDGLIFLTSDSDFHSTSPWTLKFHVALSPLSNAEFLHRMPAWMMQAAERIWQFSEFESKSGRENFFLRRRYIELGPKNWQGEWSGCFVQFLFGKLFPQKCLRYLGSWEDPWFVEKC